MIKKVLSFIGYILILGILRILFTVSFNQWRGSALTTSILLSFADHTWEYGKDHIGSLESVLNKPNPITLKLSRMVGLGSMSKERMVTLKYLYLQAFRYKDIMSGTL